MTPWLVAPTTGIVRQYEVDAPLSPEPVEEYAHRYSIDINPLKLLDAKRYINEIFVDCSGSVLVFGAGDSGSCNMFLNGCDNITAVASWDYVKEASIGLDDRIYFYDINILDGSVTEKFDYVFSSHTLEHFTKDHIFNVVMPKLISCANKAVITVVPYGDHWKDEPSHKCRFYENDEFCAMSDRYKIIWEQREIVYWKDVNENC